MVHLKFFYFFLFVACAVAHRQYFKFFFFGFLSDKVLTLWLCICNGICLLYHNVGVCGVMMMRKDSSCENSDVLLLLLVRSKIS